MVASAPLSPSPSRIPKRVVTPSPAGGMTTPTRPETSERPHLPPVAHPHLPRAQRKHRHSSSHSSNLTIVLPPSPKMPLSQSASSRDAYSSQPSTSTSSSSSQETYTSFGLKPPVTPMENLTHEAGGGVWGWVKHNLGGGPTSPRLVSLDRKAEEGGAGSIGERTSLLSPNVPRATSGRVTESPEGLPKLSRTCLIAEIKCYGKYMLPPILFFVVFVLVLALWIHSKAKL